jgi:hypothetical protein
MRLSKPQGRKRRPSSDKSDTVVAGLTLGCLGFIMLCKLAFLALVGWGLYELVNWIVTTK